MTTGQADFEARERRLDQAVQLKTPDKIPMLLFLNYYPARHVGMTLEDAHYKLEPWLAANEEVILEYEPDLYVPPFGVVMTGGLVNEALDHRQIQWAGHGVHENAPFQFVEGEYMKAEEYDEFLHDPSDFVVRKYMPRVYGALEGLSMLPSLSVMALGYSTTSLFGLLAAPQVAAAFEAMRKAAEEQARWAAPYMAFQDKMEERGFPAFYGSGAVTLAPYDMIGSLMRGMRGSMLDMFRRPEKLLAAEEKMLPVLIENAIAVCQWNKVPRVFIPLHRGADGFMSNEQFEVFYWPQLKRLVEAIVDAGLTPWIEFEGDYDQRLEYLRELPAGKVVCWFDGTDVIKAKEVLGDVLCVAGGMPMSLLAGGTPEQVRERTIKVIEGAGKNGGFIMSSNNVLDDAKPELMKVWVDTTREFGGY
jgi:hypothetical protein